MPLSLSQPSPATADQIAVSTYGWMHFGDGTWGEGGGDVGYKIESAH